MSVFMRIPSEPIYTIELDEYDDAEYSVPHWSNGVKCDDTTCGKCGDRIGPVTNTRMGVNGLEPVIEWIPVYHQYDYDPRLLLCQECANLTWWQFRENLLTLAEHLGDVPRILEMLEKPWKYVDEWWAAFGIEQDEFFAAHPAETGVPG